MVKYTNVSVQLVGKDGNAFNVLGLVLRALKRAGVPKEERDAFLDEAASGDYRHLLATAARWVNVS